MTRSAILVIVLGVAAAAAAGAIGRDSGSSDAKLARFSTGGMQVALAKSQRRAARLMGADAVYLLASRAGRAYYRVTGPHGTCYGAGPGAQVGFITGEECPEGTFPTRDQPVLDYSVYEATSRERTGDLSLFRAEGFAADGVTSVAFLGANGDIVLRLPVRANVFAGRVNDRRPVRSLVAYDSTGREVWRSG